MTPILAFDIETVPDCAGIRKLHNLPDALSDAEVAEIAFQKRRVQTGNDFLPPHLQRVVVISGVARDDEGVRTFSISEPERNEKEIIQRFFESIDKRIPQLVSWNGRGFDLPVLAARGLIHGVTAPTFWETGDGNKDFRYSNYLSRFHDRHLDLMDVLAIYSGRGSPLDELAQLAGFPGKLGMEGSAVWDNYRKGAIADIRNYCEADCANTYLLYLRFQMMRGVFNAERYAKECALLRDMLEKRPEPHWREFRNRWNA